MQHTQQNFSIVPVLVFASLALIAATAFAAGIADKPDPLLSGQADGPCDPQLAQPDLTPGTDVEGHQVAAADIETGPVSLQGQIAVPLKPARGRGGNAAYVAVDGKKLDPLLNPKPACR